MKDSSLLSYEAGPIDSIMQSTFANEHPCHLLVELSGQIDISAVQKICDEHPVLKCLYGSSFIEGGWGRLPRWKIDRNARITIETAKATASIIEFDPDVDLDPLSGMIRITILSTDSGNDCLVLSWSHVLTDARGGEEIIKILSGVTSAATVGPRKIKSSNPTALLKGSTFGSYCKTRRSCGPEQRIEKVQRYSVTIDKNSLWEKDKNPFFRSITLLAAYVKAINPSKPIICGIPVSEGRTRIFPGNQLGILHLHAEPGDSTELYKKLLAEMEHVVRSGFPKDSLAMISLASRFGKKIFTHILQYPACNRFADICVTSLGASTIPQKLFEQTVLQVRHYPPTFPWGGSTLVYYEFGTLAHLIFLGEDGGLLKKIVENINRY